jgi:hypothetical protein
VYENVYFSVVRTTFSANYFRDFPLLTQHQPPSQVQRKAPILSQHIVAYVSKLKLTPSLRIQYAAGLRIH